MLTVDRFGRERRVEPRYFKEEREAARDEKRMEELARTVGRKLVTATDDQLRAVAAMAEPKTPGNVGALADAARYYMERRGVK